MTYTNVKTCHETGRKITPGDQIIQTPSGHVYAVKAAVKLSRARRAAIEAELDALYAPVVEAVRDDDAAQL